MIGVVVGTTAVGGTAVVGARVGRTLVGGTAVVGTEVDGGTAVVGARVGGAFVGGTFVGLSTGGGFGFPGSGVDVLGGMNRAGVEVIEGVCVGVNGT